LTSYRRTYRRTYQEHAAAREAQDRRNRAALASSAHALLDSGAFALSQVTRVDQCPAEAHNLGSAGATPAPATPGGREIGSTWSYCRRCDAYRTISIRASWLGEVDVCLTCGRSAKEAA
jgi:hypothetical protein